MKTLGKKSIPFMILIICLTGMIFYKARGQTTEWKVKIGDKKSYTYTKYNREGESEWTREITTESGKANVTMKKGLQITIEITKLTSTSAYGKTTYNKEVTQIESAVTEVMKVYDSKEDWEAALESLGGSYKLEGDLLVFNPAASTLMKWDIKTGWLTYSYMKIGKSEVEMTEGTGAAESSPILLLVNLTALVIITMIGKKRSLR